MTWRLNVKCLAHCSDVVKSDKNAAARTCFGTLFSLRVYDQPDPFGERESTFRKCDFDRSFTIMLIMMKTCKAQMRSKTVLSAVQ